MKNKIKWIGILVFSLLAIQLVSAAIGVGYPYPSELELRPGEEGRFQFEIQSTPESGPVTCTYTMEKEIPLIVEFDEQIIPITSAKETIRMPVYGTILTDFETKLGKYSTSFCVSCSPTNLNAPIGAIGNYCGLTLGISMVDERTRENPYIPPKPLNYIILLIFSGIIVLAIIILLLIWHIIKKRK